MSIRNAAGTIQTKTTVMSSMTDVTDDASKTYRFDGAADLYEGFQPDGAAGFEAAVYRKLAFKVGQSYTKSQIDRYYPVATVTAITPNTGAAAGGTVVTITGTNFSGVTGVTFGGTAGTSFSVVNNNTIKVTTPAKTAGAYDVVLADDAGNVTVTNGFTYS